MAGSDEKKMKEAQTHLDKLHAELKKKVKERQTRLNDACSSSDSKDAKELQREVQALEKAEDAYLTMMGKVAKKLKSMK